MKLPGGYSRPALPSSVFNRPISFLPTPKQAAKKLKQEDVQLKYFMEKDTLEFDPEKRTAEKYNNVVTSRQKHEIVNIFMTQDLLSTEQTKNCIVHNVGKLRSPLILSAYKEGTQVPIRMY